jgi:hypothetical protein
MSESLLLDNVPPPFVRTAYAKDGHPQKPFHHGTYLRFGATFLAGFVVCLLMMLVLMHTKSPTQSAPSVTEADTKKMSVHDTVKAAGTSVLRAIGIPSAHPSHVKSLHLVGRNGMDYGPLVPISAPTFATSTPYPARSFTVHDKAMDCFATYNYAGYYNGFTYNPPANGGGGPDTDWLTRDELSFGLLRQMVLAIDPIPSPNPYTGSTQQSGIFLSFSSKDCTGTPLFDIAQPYSVQTTSGSDIMLDFCYGVQTQEPSFAYSQVSQAQLRAFKFVEPKRKIHVSAPKSYCVFAPKPLPALNGTRTDYRLCDKCFQVKSLSAHPIWVELVDVTQNLPVQMPKKPVMLKWK